MVDKFTAPKVHDENAELFTNRIVNLKKTQDLWGEAIAKHLLPAPCGGKIVWDMAAEVQQGICWHERL